ncbi:argininosuccinate lyase [Melittangium boletus]|uniref:Argininosuccinate lyase n=1 Tax=Melittangium boletus DSM 14713 TaxID=1294270 RepID=A0A250IRE6_9BACT|nr:argininosuccinate lyase [Melittangium boletus]ATB34304.1 argininosuccinate lyase [Melittangium boletus DSM 14713]
MSAQTIGRLSKPPHPELFEALYEPRFIDDLEHVLPHLLDIDLAHVVMLGHRGILSREIAAPLLSLNREMAEQVRTGASLFTPPPSHRGLYLLYESQYVERLGGEIGGAAHIARSRNDINAAVTRMRAREGLLDLLGGCVELARAMSALAAAHVETAMPAFTHLQPAQPSSLGHYLSAVLSEVLRTAHWLLEAYPRLNQSPMGAAAGVGTSFAIDREEVARLLGFTSVIANSADSVASRDYVIHVLSGASLLGITLTRMATDLQAWASHAYGFLTWPDDMVSTSSIMPQKRNAFVLENIRGQGAQASGGLMNALLGMKNTPFSNSVEVSAESTAPLWPALDSTRLALRLSTLLMKNVIVHPARMSEFLRAADTTMTALADYLVSRHGLSFRTAHDVVGKLVSRLSGAPAPGLADLKLGLEALLVEKTQRAFALDEAELARVLDPDTGLRAAAYGGGPAPDAVREQLRQLDAQRELLVTRVEEHRQHLSQASADLTRAALALTTDAR